MRYHIKFYNVAGNKIAEHEEFDGGDYDYAGGSFYEDLRCLIDRFRSKDPRIVRVTVDITL